MSDSEEPTGGMFDRVIICGDRTWVDGEVVRAIIGSLPSHCVVIHGNARGVDRLAGLYAEQCGLEVIAVPADWGRYGRAAGPVRNRAMLDQHHPTCVIAIHNDIGSSKGTRDMVIQAKAARIPTLIVSTVEKSQADLEAIEREVAYITGEDADERIRGLFSRVIDREEGTVKEYTPQ